MPRNVGLGGWLSVLAPGMLASPTLRGCLDPLAPGDAGI